MVDILVLYCSQDGSVHKLAQQIARGVNSVTGAEAKLRTVVEPAVRLVDYKVDSHFLVVDRVRKRLPDRPSKVIRCKKG